MLTKILAALIIFLSPPLLAMFDQEQDTQPDGDMISNLHQIASGLGSNLTIFQKIPVSPDTVKAVFPIVVLNYKNHDIKKRQEKNPTITQKAQQKVEHANLMLQALVNVQKNGNISLYDLTQAIFPNDDIDVALISVTALLMDYSTVLPYFYKVGTPPSKASDAPPNYRAIHLGAPPEPRPADRLSRAAFDDISKAVQLIKSSFGEDLVKKIQKLSDSSYTPNRTDIGKYDDEIALTFFRPKMQEIRPYLSINPWSMGQTFIDTRMCEMALNALPANSFKNEDILNAIAQEFQLMIHERDWEQPPQHEFMTIINAKVARYGYTQLTGSHLLNAGSEFLKTAGIDECKADWLAGFLLVESINRALMSSQSPQKEGFLALLANTFSSFTGDAFKLYQITGINSQAFSTAYHDKQKLTEVITMTCNALCSDDYCQFAAYLGMDFSRAQQIRDDNHRNQRDANNQMLDEAIKGLDAKAGINKIRLAFEQMNYALYTDTIDKTCD